MAVGGVQRQKTGLQTCFFITQFLHEGCIKLQRFHRLLRRLACSQCGLVFLGVAHKSQHQVFARATTFGFHDPAGGPLSIRYFLQPVGLQCQCRVGHILQARVNRGAHDQTVCINVVVVAVCPLNQPALELLCEMRRRAEWGVLPFKVDL